MNRFRELLLSRYSEHFSRLNCCDDTGSKSAGMIKHRNNLRVTLKGLVETVPRDGEVLDLGCGAGALLEVLSDFPSIRTTGVDVSQSQLRICRETLPQVSVFCEDGLAFLQNNPSRFSGIFCLDVLEHVPGDELCFQWAEAARAALTPGGFFCCAVPNAANIIGTFHRYCDWTHERMFTRATLITLLELAGYADVRIIPLRSASWSGRARLWMEAAAHQLIFRLCGHKLETVFTYDLFGVGLRSLDEPGS